jgi:hypothetical protein
MVAQAEERGNATAVAAQTISVFAFMGIPFGKMIF